MMAMFILAERTCANCSGLSFFSVSLCLCGCYLTTEAQRHREKSAFGGRFGVGDTHWMRATARVAHSSRAAIGAVYVAVAVLGFFPETAEDHLAGGGLQHAGHGDVGVLADQPARIIHYHHRAVVEISHTLVVFLALFQDEYAHRFAR